MRQLKLLAALTQAGASALSALWTFPSMLLSAFLVAWGAEAKNEAVEISSFTFRKGISL